VRDPKSGKSNGTADSDRSRQAPRPPDVVAVLRRIDQIGPARFAVGALLVFFGLSALAYFPAWPGDPSRLVHCVCGDTVQQSWFLGWFSWALFHGHNPFLTNWLDYPSGVNLAANTEMPLLGLISAPLSLTVGPVASYGLLLYLAYPLSAASAFFVLRRWTGSNLGALCGGLLYGFSPYMVGQGLFHLNLVFVPLPPLIFLALHEIAVVQRSSAPRWGVLLGVLVAAQYLISPEVLATTGALAVLALAVLVVARFRSIGRVRLAHIARTVLPGLGIPVVILSYPVYLLLAGPRHLNGPAFPLENAWRADLVGIVVPTSAQLVAPMSVVRFGNTLSGSISENGSYIGIPLLLLSLACIVRYWHNSWIRLTSTLAAFAFLLSLGPRLVIAGHSTPIPLPFDLLGRLPLFDNALPARISLYATFFVAVIVSIGIASVVAGQRARHTRRRISWQVTVLGLALAAVISLLPNWPDRTVNLNSAVPAFFTTSSFSRAIPSGTVVLAFPFPMYPFDDAMIWQVDDDWHWKLVGGYALIPAPHAPTEQPPQLRPLAVQSFLVLSDEKVGQPDSATPTPIPANPALARDLRAYVHRNGITAIIFEPVGRDPGLVLAAFEAAFGSPKKAGGVDFWTASQLGGRSETR